ncbi:MAG: type II toxin-antitoxin system HicB family antitoxin [Bryobacteraceae bacterium]|jgi:predicted RNase H-like HicB family nuclease
MRTFTVIIHEEPTGGFSALPGCYSQGESIDELLGNLREAIAGVLEVMQEEGLSPEASIQVVELAV